MVLFIKVLVVVSDLLVPLEQVAFCVREHDLALLLITIVEPIWVVLFLLEEVFLELGLKGALLVYQLFHLTQFYLQLLLSELCLATVVHLPISHLNLNFENLK